MVPLLAVLFGLSLTGQACPHEGSEHRLLGEIGCPTQRKLTIEGVCPPRTICSFHLFKVKLGSQASSPVEFRSGNRKSGHSLTQATVIGPRAIGGADA